MNKKGSKEGKKASNNNIDIKNVNMGLSNVIYTKPIDDF